jgi:hypothetical protein
LQSGSCLESAFTRGENCHEIPSYPSTHSLHTTTEKGKPSDPFVNSASTARAQTDHRDERKRYPILCKVLQRDGISSEGRGGGYKTVKKLLIYSRQMNTT